MVIWKVLILEEFVFKDNGLVKVVGYVFYELKNLKFLDLLWNEIDILSLNIF